MSVRWESKRSALEAVKTRECVTSGRVLEEVLALAEHHENILRCKFPGYTYYIYEYPLRRIQLAAREGSAVILTASFSNSSILIVTPSIGPKFVEELSYADPRFTDNVLLERLVE